MAGMWIQLCVLLIGTRLVSSQLCKITAEGSKTCQFPFTYQGKNYWTCVKGLTGLTGGAAYCGTKTGTKPVTNAVADMKKCTIPTTFYTGTKTDTGVSCFTGSVKITYSGTSSKTVTGCVYDKRPAIPAKTAGTNNPATPAQAAMTKSDTKAWCSFEANVPQKVATTKNPGWGYCKLPGTEYCGKPPAPCDVTVKQSSLQTNDIKCTIPFVYNKIIYTSCISANNNNVHWCTQDATFQAASKQWGNCPAQNKPKTTDGKTCANAFTYGGITFHGCTTWGLEENFYMEGKQSWCGLVANVATFDKKTPNTQWGFCDYTAATCTKSEPAEKPCALQTTGGNANGAVCKFPFTYKKKKYEGCITTPTVSTSGGSSWCGTVPNVFPKDPVYEKWGKCGAPCPKPPTPACPVPTAKGRGSTGNNQRACLLPFTYNGKTSAHCTNEGSKDAMWCYTTPAGKTAQEWGECIINDETGKRCARNFKYVKGSSTTVIKTCTHTDSPDTSANKKQWCALEVAGVAQPTITVADLAATTNKKWGYCDFKGICPKQLLPKAGLAPKCKVPTVQTDPKVKAADCTFAFTYGTQVYETCIDFDKTGVFRCLTDQKTHKWGDCRYRTIENRKDCLASWRYKNKDYTQCTTVDSPSGTAPWCAINPAISSYNSALTTANHQYWGRCDTQGSCTPPVPEPTCPVPTQGGTANSADCFFPFTNKLTGKVHKTCTDESSNGRLWCGTDATSSKFGFCAYKTEGNPAQQQECVFPFKYKGQLHYACTDSESLDASKRWCAVSAGSGPLPEITSITTANQHTVWGYCDFKGVCPKVVSTLKATCPIHTSIGDVKQKNCKIPFKYANQDYYNCIDRKNNGLFQCMRDDSSWGDCQFYTDGGMPCSKMYTFQGKIYSQCTADNSLTFGRQWCATRGTSVVTIGDLNTPGSKKWGYCNFGGKCFELPKPTCPVYTINDKICKFPFNHDGKTFETCAEYGTPTDRRYFCYLNAARTEFSDCQFYTTKGSKCANTFKYKNTVHRKCIENDSPTGDPWCAIRKTAVEPVLAALPAATLDTDWGYCDFRGRCPNQVSKVQANCPVPTIGAGAKGPNCKFPFTIDGGTQYNSCVDKDFNGIYQCKTAAGVWANCQFYSDKNKKCAKTFTYNGVQVEQCTKLGSLDPTKSWCLHADVTPAAIVSSQLTLANPGWGFCSYDGYCAPLPQIQPTCKVPSDTGVDCKFPFVYKGVSRTNCIDVDALSILWCLDGNGKFGKCNYRTEQKKTCSQKFKYNGKMYERCTYDGSPDVSKAWCALVSTSPVIPAFTGTLINPGVSWDYCDFKGICGVTPGPGPGPGPGPAPTPGPGPGPTPTPAAPKCPTPTEGGNAGGANCVFPFVYENQEYQTCTIVKNGGTPWCMTDKAATKYGNCIESTEDGGKCVFPFIYGGKQFSGCIMDNSAKPWCATTANYDTDKKYGNCAGPPCVTPKPPTAEPPTAACRVPTKSGKDCAFPFDYGGKTYKDKCSTDNNNDIAWCYTDTAKKAFSNCITITGEDGNEKGKECVFPFTFEKKEYKACIPWTQGKSWCATTKSFDTDLKWGNCLPCAPACKEATTGGNAAGATCAIPFKYDGKEYSECTSLDSSDTDKKWCATTADYSKDKKWGYCAGCATATPTPTPTPSPAAVTPTPQACPQGTKTSSGKNCVFPFTYQTKQYSTCISEGDSQSKLWCGTTSNYDLNRQWGYCEGCAVSGTPTPSPVATPAPTTDLSACKNGVAYKEYKSTLSYGGSAQAASITNNVACAALCTASCNAFDFDPTPSVKCYLHIGTAYLNAANLRLNTAGGVSQWRKVSCDQIQGCVFIPQLNTGAFNGQIQSSYKTVKSCQEACARVATCGAVDFDAQNGCWFHGTGARTTYKSTTVNQYVKPANCNV